MNTQDQNTQSVDTAQDDQSPDTAQNSQSPAEAQNAEAAPQDAAAAQPPVLPKPILQIAMEFAAPDTIICNNFNTNLQATLQGAIQRATSALPEGVSPEGLQIKLAELPIEERLALLSTQNEYLMARVQLLATTMGNLLHSMQSAHLASQLTGG